MNNIVFGMHTIPVGKQHCDCLVETQSRCPWTVAQESPQHSPLSQWGRVESP